MSDKDETNVVDINKHRNKKSEFDIEKDPTMETVLKLSDDIDDVLEDYLNIGISFELVASVLANRLGTLLSAGKAAGIQDMTDLCVDILLKEAEFKQDPT